MRIRFALVVLLMSAASIFDASPINDDFIYLRKIFPGQYDNSWQVFMDMVIDLPPPLQHQRFSAEIFAENVPIFPSNVATFYLQEYTGGDPKNIVRQKIYAFQINSTTQEIITKFYSFVDPAKFINAQDNPGLFQNLTWSDLIYLPGCDVKWDRVEPYLFRTSAIDRCVIVYNNVSYEIVDSNDLTQNYLTVNEKWTFVSNGSVFRAGMPYNLTKLDTPKRTKPISQHALGVPRRQLNSFEEIITALSHALPVTLYIDVPTCKLGNSSNKSTETLNAGDDFAIQGYSVDIDTFELFNSSVFGPYPYFGFSDTPIVRTSRGDMFQLREGKFYSVGGIFLTVTWLNPANYSRAQQFIFGCQLHDPTRGNSGQIMAVTSDLNLTRVNSFGQLVSAIKSGYNFRFYVRYMNCKQGPKVNAFAGGIIEGMNLDPMGKSVSFGKSKLITNYQGSGYVTDVVTGVIYENGFYATFTASDDYVQTFKRVYIETFVCDMTSSSVQGAVDLYMY
ncbi:uncharacterized protein LOC135479593 [Liolophura sinensis]|uniref:uncharacterized protein LOC135479593 n=1 Tax=Liolophura sinensis TaxID=3198878 RepID=UPI003158572A